MATLNIRGIPEHVHNLLKAEADSSNRSVTAVVLQALQEHADSLLARKRREQARAQMDLLRESYFQQNGLTDDVVQMIRDDRDR